MLVRRHRLYFLPQIYIISHASSLHHDFFPSPICSIIIFGDISYPTVLAPNQVGS
jgi:hypothetical protein